MFGEENKEDLVESPQIAFDMDNPEIKAIIEKDNEIDNSPDEKIEPPEEGGAPSKGKKPQKAPTDDESGEGGNGKSEETSPDPPEKDGEGKPPSSKADAGKKPEESGEDDDFEVKVLTSISDLKNPEDRKQFLKDLENREKFRASLTETSKVLAKDKAEVDAVKQLIDMEAFKTLQSDEDFLTATDSYFEDNEGGNPFRKMIEGFGNVSKKQSELDPIQQKEFELSIKEKRLDLTKIDERFADDKEFTGLLDKAIENEVTLDTAYKLFYEIPDKDAKIDALTVKNKQLSKELKDRNKE